MTVPSWRKTITLGRIGSSIINISAAHKTVCNFGHRHAVSAYPRSVPRFQSPCARLSAATPRDSILAHLSRASGCEDPEQLGLSLSHDIGIVTGGFQVSELLIRSTECSSAESFVQTASKLNTLTMRFSHAYVLACVLGLIVLPKRALAEKQEDSSSRPVTYIATIAKHVDIKALHESLRAKTQSDASGPLEGASFTVHRQIGAIVVAGREGTCAELLGIDGVTNCEEDAVITAA